MYYPLRLTILYLTVTYLLYFFGPIAWPDNNNGILLFFLAVNTVFIYVGFSLGVKLENANTKKIDWETFFKIGAISTLVMFVPITLAYTNKWPWEVFSILSNQGEIYSENIARLQDTKTDRWLLALIKGFNGPLFYGSVTIGFLRFNLLKPKEKFLLLSVILSQVIFSTLRGVDKEIGDLLIMFFAAQAITKFRKYHVNQTNAENINLEEKNDLNRPKNIDSRRNISFKYFSYIAIILIFLYNFTEKKMSRLGESYADFSILDSSIHPDYSRPIISWMSPYFAFSFAMISSYMCQGYYGLSLVLNKPFNFSFGFGHSAALTSFIDGLNKNASIYKNTYLSMMSELGWDDQYVWSSVYPWIASDVSFYLTPFVILLLSIFYGKLWIEAIQSNSDIPGILFCFMSIFFAYIPANNQIAQSLDSYFGFLFWVFMYFKANKRHVRQ